MAKRVVSIRLSEETVAAIDRRLEEQNGDPERWRAERHRLRAYYERRQPSLSSYVRQLIGRDLELDPREL